MADLSAIETILPDEGTGGPREPTVAAMPRRRVNTLLLTGIFVVSLFFALYFARVILLPILFAFLLSLLLQPAMNGLLKLRLPKPIASALIIVVLYGALGGLGSLVGPPAAEWFAKAPASVERLQNKIGSASGLLTKLDRATAQVEKMAAPSTTGDAPPVTVQGPRLRSILVAGTRDALTGLFTMTVLLFFLLMAGDQFLRRVVEVAPTLTDKKQVVEIAREVERSMSGYLLTIALMNGALGAVTALIAWGCGLDDALLWGTLAFLLNFIPILGPVVMTAVMFMAGLVQFNSLTLAALPAGLYFAAHLVEAETVTPLLLAKRFVLNPVMIILALVFWYWMWGVPGAFLAVPMLATFKILCDRVEPLMPLGHFLAGESTQGTTPNGYGNGNTPS